MSQKNVIKIVLKSMGLIALLIFLYFIAMLLFLGVYGTGSQASTELSNGGFASFLLYSFPLLIVGFITYKTFLKK